MGTIKDRNGKDLTEAEEIKKRWQEYTEEIYNKVSLLFRHSVVSDYLRSHGLQPTRVLCPWDFPGKSTGVGCHCLY